MDRFSKHSTIPAHTREGQIGKWLRYLSQPMDGASVAVFRVCFGLLMAVEAGRYLGFGWVRRIYVEPTFHFTFFPFLKPWGGDGMYWHFAGLGVLGLMMAVGWHYRFASGLFCVGFTYVFLLEKAQYLNHLYLVCLLSLLLFLIPAHRCWSLDAWRQRGEWNGQVPRWGLFVLRFQVVLVYVYAAMAKLNVDWLRGEPQRFWLANRVELPVLGPYLTQEWAVWLVTYTGLGIDLVIGFLLLWRRTFWFAACVAFAFHMGNAYLFSIGIFPLLMMVTVGLFPSPDWPRSYAWEIRRRFAPLCERLRRIGSGLERLVPGHAGSGSSSGGDMPADGGSSVWRNPFLSFRRGRAPKPTVTHERRTRGELMIVCALHMYVIVQVLAPWRHLLYPGNVHWTEEGHRFSWHMMLRHKDVRFAMFLSDDQTGWRQEIDLARMLTERQRRKMPSRPDLIHQFALYVADRHEVEHGVRPRVYAQALASLNRGPWQFLIDPHVDLAAEPRTWRAKTWIVPLKERK